MNQNFQFHISLPCDDVRTTKAFYVEELGFKTGREAVNWVDINLYGNQITFAQHVCPTITTKNYSLDGNRLPVFHIGLLMDRENWKRELKKHLTKDYLEIEPSSFLKGKIGEHDSFFIKDPNNYYLEFKTFSDQDGIFEKTN